ncbi:hypothetical protein VKT23_009693 [Stygiomarasmius scandens]|uniref:Uncharacterized protein n=1 Tax=Marasmiellus scandens TaxID=2682957 RepID=A0ABR1JE37_9AGAR
MPTTRAQEKHFNDTTSDQIDPKPSAKRQVSQNAPDELPKKKTKAREIPREEEYSESSDHSQTDFRPEVGTIERGHIYFFYRNKVQKEQAKSIDDVKNFHILLVPRPPEFAVHDDNHPLKNETESSSDMKLLELGADAIPAPAEFTHKKKYRLITVGKKKLPDPEHGGPGKGPKEAFWATVTSVGEDLDQLEKGLGEKNYETKTRGSSHEEPARLVGRGAYAIVNNDPPVPSKRETHLGYHLSHPSPSEIGEVQTSLGIQTASSFIVQVKNPSAPNTGQGFSAGKGADYPEWIMDKVFGRNGQKGRESYGLRFASCETTRLLDFEGAQLLLVAARGDEEGLERSLGDGRGNALTKIENEERSHTVDSVFKELNLDRNAFTAKPINGEWI